MDIEQLKLVLATVQGVSGDAFKVGAIYIGAQFLKELVAYGMGGAILFTAYKAIGMVANAILSSQDAVQGIRRIRKSLGIASSFGESDYDINQRTIDQAVATVEALLKGKA